LIINGIESGARNRTLTPQAAVIKLCPVIAVGIEEGGGNV